MTICFHDFINYFLFTNFNYNLIKTGIFNRKTVEFCRQMEAAGISFLTVHGRTVEQRSTPVSLESIAEIKKSLRIPVIANGDIKSMQDCENVQKMTGVNG